MPVFPSPEWLPAAMEKLNSDSKYAQVAQKWEGDLLCVIHPSGALKKTLLYYLDLWHGKCRGVRELEEGHGLTPVLQLTAPYENYVKLLRGEIDPVQALMTRKLAVKGSMGLLMRNIPTVLEFVRCAREVTTGVLTEE
ncbi:MAG: SCP2 sterol-binding domain-containing protein [Anaerolineales bacterium]|nr:SCP2 sterol-binding domain-containing protein [Anaerolineales bacterium]